MKWNWYVLMNEFGYKIDFKKSRKSLSGLTGWGKDTVWISTDIDHKCPKCGGLRWLDANNSCQCAGSEP